MFSVSFLAGSHDGGGGGGGITLEAIPTVITNEAGGTLVGYTITNVKGVSSHYLKQDSGNQNLVPEWIIGASLDPTDYEVRATFSRTSSMTGSESGVWFDLATGSETWQFDDAQTQALTLDVRHKVNLTIEATRSFTLDGTT